MAVFDLNTAKHKSLKILLITENVLYESMLLFYITKNIHSHHYQDTKKCYNLNTNFYTL